MYLLVLIGGWVTELNRVLAFEGDKARLWASAGQAARPLGT